MPARPDLRRILEAQVGGDGQSGSGRAHHGSPSCLATGCLYPSSREAVGHRARCLFPSPTKNGGGIRNTVARPCRSNGSSSRGALATKQSMFPLRLDGSSLALAMKVQNKPRRRPLSLPPLRGGGIRGSEFAARRPRRLVVLFLQGPSRERRGAATRNPTGRRN